MKKSLLFITSILYVGCVSSKVTKNVQTENTAITYTLSMPEPHTHYFQVGMEIDTKGMDSLIVKMPVWAPGSYLVREFARNVDSFNAHANGKPVDHYKLNKNTWVVKSKGATKVDLSYHVYAFEISVRTSFLDADGGYLNGTSVFMYVPAFKNSPSTLKINPFNNWKTISTSLEETEKNSFKASTYDELADSPIQIGNQKVLSFDLNNITHYIAMVGDYNLSNKTEEQFIADIKTVCRQSTDIFGSNPCKSYTFIVQHYPSGPNVNGGGLEHLNSTTLITRPDAYTTAAGYRGFLSLVAHEYFHLWNVKRIRPVELGPFDYDSENYTTSLWIAEGITSYYQDKILRMANLMNAEDYTKLLSSEIAAIENQPGQRVQSVAESSKDAWIKYYRQNENSRNSTISYYDKGGVLGFVINAQILANTEGQKSLDDVYKALWKKYLIDGKGYSEADFRNELEKQSGVSFAQFYKDYVHGTKPLDYKSMLSPCGINFNVAALDLPYFGASVTNGKVTSLLKGSSAYDAGLNVGDEILTIDGQKPSSQINDVFVKFKLGADIPVSIRRYGKERLLTLTVKPNPNKDFQLSLKEQPTELEKKILSKLITF